MRLLILEDEPMVSRRLERICTAFLGDGEGLVTVTDSIDQAAKVIAAGGVDVFILDLAVHGADGFAALERKPANPPAVVVVSAHPERAIEAFQYEVVDFVAKPFSQERLELALRRAQARRVTIEAASILLSSARGLEPTAMDDIVAFFGADDYAEALLVDGRRLLQNKRLAGLCAVLPAEFTRVHRSAIVNLRHVRAMVRRPLGGYEVVLSSGDRAPIGRSRERELRARLGTALG